MASSASTMVTDTLDRLSSKSGVVASLAIERTSGSILAFKGTLQLHLQFPVSNVSVVAPHSPTTPMSVLPQQSATGTAPPAVSPVDSGAFSAQNEVNEFAQMIWKYVNGTEQMIQGMDDEDDLKLLRLRTKKHEFVIVPDAKFVFVVVHDVKSS